VAIQLPGPDRVPPGPVRDFVSALHEIYIAAGQPAARTLARATDGLPPREYQSVSHETISATLRGSSIPAWEKIRSLLRVLVDLSPDEHDWVALVRRMNRLWAATRTAHPDDWVAGGIDPPEIRPSVISVAAPIRPAVTIQPPAIAPPAASPPPGAIRNALPDLTASFVGREDLLETMRSTLDANLDARFVLHGAVGVGKTQLVRRFIEDHGDAYGLIWWVSAQTVETAHVSLLELAGALDLPRSHRIHLVVQSMVQRLESRQLRYLLVFDDVTDEAVRALAPTVGGHVIITTRNPGWGHDESSIGLEVPCLSDAEAGALLRGCDAGLTAEQIRSLVGQVGATPLALEQLAAWRRATGGPWDRCAHVGPDQLDAAPPAHYPHTATVSVLLALDRLEAANPAALRLVELLAWFGLAPVPTALLSRASEARVTEPLASALRNEVQLRRALADLSRHGLVRLTREDSRVELLPLARLTLRHALGPDDAGRVREQVHAVLAATDPGWPDDLEESDAVHAEIAAHVVPTGLVESPAVEARRLVFHQIRYRYLVGDYAEARVLGELAVATWQHSPCADENYLVLRTTQQLANALRAVGEHEKARTLIVNAMSQLRLDPDCGEDHEYTLAMAASRAADLRIAGEYSRALNVAGETFQRCVNLFGDTDPRTIMSRHNLAVSLRLAGEFTRAEAEDRTALAQHQQRFDDDNWRTLLSVNALAEDLFGLGRYAAVTELAPRLAAASRQPRTRMHRGLVLAGRTMALARRGLGQPAEALDMLGAHQAECLDLFGDRHEYTLAVRMSYANTLHQLGRAEEAHEHARQAYDAYHTSFGEQNPLTLAAKVNLAAILRTLGERRQAWESDDVAGEALRETVGPRHPFTVAAAVNLASDYALEGHPNTLRVSRSAYEAALKAHGGDHPDVLAAAANLALDLAATGAQSRASELRQRTLDRLNRKFGPDHPMIGVVAQGQRVDCAVEPPSA
jgi:tetratricopeptide (TPR) repeat protein